jgi:chromosome segregation protein
MYLKDLTVLGFKSFADRTTLSFPAGITAIVGPNGCGKSNIAEAIRWVLGEQSAKALRGDEMADVIFSGTESRKPLGMAEVSLTVGDVDTAHLKAAGIEMPYSEVTITRRVFRDGGSEYFINRTPCRLKDIQQLFMGTGVGRASYSIMAQGNITQILSSKPEDRRLVFEEAAGITRFKAQKKEALRKLEYTEQNLVRVADLIREVKRQIGSLQRQAGKARRYKQLMRDLQHLETQLARHQFDVLLTDIRGRQTLVDNLRRQIEMSSVHVLRRENETAQLRTRLSALEEQIHGSQEHGLQLKNQIGNLENRIHFNQERLRELETQNAKALSDIAQAEERRLAAEQELATVTGKLAASTAALAKQRMKLENRRKAVASLEENMAIEQENLRQAQAASFATAQQLSRVRNEINALDLQKQGNAVRLEKLSAEKIQLEEERARLEQRLQEFAANVAAEKANAQTQRGNVEERLDRLRQVEQKLSQTTQLLDDLLRQQAENRSRLTVLDQLDEAHEGFSAGTITVLRQSRHVLGSLADRLRVPDRYVAAIETALGHHLQSVLTEHPEAAQEILADLNMHKKGRASIAALGLSRNGNSQPPLNSESLPDGAMHALSVVDADADVRPLLSRLLERTLIVPDLKVATAAWRACEGEFDFVALSGDLLSRHGIYTGGNGNGDTSTAAPSSILARRNQIAGLRARLVELQVQVNETSRQKGAWQSECTLLQAGLQQAQSELRSQEVAIATREGEFKVLENSLQVLHQKIDTVVYEIQSLAALEQESLQRRTALTAQAAELETQEGAAQQQVTELSSRLEALRQQRDAANAALTEAKIALATEEQVGASYRNQKQPIETRIAELGQFVRQRRGEISACLERKEQAQVEIEQARQGIVSLEYECEQVNRRVADLILERESLKTNLAAGEEDLQNQRQHLAQLQEQKGALEIELAQKHMSVQNLRERIQQKYQVNLDDVRSECITITIASEGPPRIHTLSPEEMAASGASTDWNAVAEQITALQQRIDEMGPVNLVAIEEYEETEQRYKFLSQQNEDLIQARAQLLEVINRINKQTREMFSTTFAEIRESFRSLFAEIFDGGKADLFLVDEGDVLESGIEIMARPPGKHLQSVSLLSGGEQTMAAVALLFAIYQVKPSPFCVLDELDAPLDESNINRFVRILRRFLSGSQFVVITHNKRTIGMAEVLYGITMQEQGVSKLVSVKFHKAADEVRDHAPSPLESPAPGPQIEEEEDESRPRDETLELVMAR